MFLKNEGEFSHGKSREPAFPESLFLAAPFLGGLLHSARVPIAESSGADKGKRLCDLLHFTLVPFPM